jgi:hypothetical protein
MITMRQIITVSSVQSGTLHLRIPLQENFFSKVWKFILISKMIGFENCKVFWNHIGVFYDVMVNDQKKIVYYLTSFKYFTHHLPLTTLTSCFNYKYIFNSKFEMSFQSCSYDPWAHHSWIVDILNVCFLAWRNFLISPNDY